jgi:dihydroorotate dehydrogenase electron transfer subunit
MVEVVEQRAATSRLRWLSLHAPDLAREVRAGQLLMVRCTEPGTFDPLLRRALFVAACEPALGQVALLFAPDTDPGLRWLARVRPGDSLDVLGPLGRPFQLDTRTRSMVLVGEGVAVGALLMLARELLGRGGAATLLVAASDEMLLPPPFLLPADVEYQSTAGRAVDLLIQDTGAAKSPGQSGSRHSMAAWADQICAVLPHDQVARLRAVVQANRMRWERGFASVLIETVLPCGVGTCGVCQIALRKGLRLACVDGPVFDLRDCG